MMISFYMLLLIPALSLGVEIVQSPDENVWVENAKEKDLICATDESWQWCQWEHTDGNDEIHQYQTGQKYSTLETSDPLIRFIELSETTCGIKILEADPIKHKVT